ncbi:hypothetical protein SSX86_007563 [Deinandra increscens subsp. villosa]|uniref:Uncharacterized protein n=1 Tax=Deinandra increscens subsp. villosa TaxID=3103831 RepID=A0AAP0DLE0_9ASTR
MEAVTASIDAQINKVTCQLREDLQKLDDILSHQPTQALTEEANLVRVAGTSCRYELITAKDVDSRISTSFDDWGFGLRGSLRNDEFGNRENSFRLFTASLRYATEHRCRVFVKVPKQSGNILGTDPLNDHNLLLEAQPLDGVLTIHTRGVPTSGQAAGIFSASLGIFPYIKI